MNPKKSDYIDRTIIKLKRKYGKDELVAHLNNTIREKDIEIGQLKSEIDYLSNELKIDKETREINRQARAQQKKDDNYKQILQQNKSLRESLSNMRKIRDELLAKLNIEHGN